MIFWVFFIYEPEQNSFYPCHVFNFWSRLTFLNRIFQNILSMDFLTYIKNVFFSCFYCFQWKSQVWFQSIFLNQPWWLIGPLVADKLRHTFIRMLLTLHSLCQTFYHIIFLNCPLGFHKITTLIWSQNHSNAAGWGCLAGVLISG